jgi:uncharacterized protein YoxC
MPMDGVYLSKAVHDEYAKRMEDEHKRQNKRISDLEIKVEDIGSLTASVESLAKSVEQMAKAQEKQSKRLETLEGRDGEMWRKVVGYAATFVVGAVLTFIFAKIGL